MAGMRWHSKALAELAAGREVVVRPCEHPMRPVIMPGARVLLRPLRPEEKLRPRQIVFAHLAGAWYLRRLKAVEGPRVQIASERGRANGWTHRRNVAGLVVWIDNFPTRG